MDIAFLSIFDSFREGVIALSDGAVIYSNKAAEKFFSADILGKRGDSLVSPLLTEGTAKMYGSVRSGKKEAPVIADTFDKYRIITVFFSDEDDEIPFKVLASTSQIIKQTMSVFQMSSNLLRSAVDDLKDEKLEKYREMLEQSGYKLIRLTNNLAQIGTVDLGNGESDISCMDIAEVCRDIVADVGRLIRKNSVSLTFECPEDRILFNGDKEKIEILILNLLSNSLKYVKDIGRITLSLKSQGDRVIISVSDNGGGVSEDVLPTVFMRYRETRSMTDTEAGLGVGLPLVQHIARMHDGSAVLESTEKGTTVTVMLRSKDIGDIFKTTQTEYSTNGMRLILTELSDVLPQECYSSRYLD